MGLHTFCMEPPIHAWCAQYSYEHTVHDLLSRTCTGTVKLYYRLYRYEYCRAERHTGRPSQNSAVARRQPAASQPASQQAARLGRGPYRLSYGIA